MILGKRVVPIPCRYDGMISSSCLHTPASTAAAACLLTVLPLELHGAVLCDCRALGFEPKKEEIKKMIADIDKDGRSVSSTSSPAAETQTADCLSMERLVWVSSQMVCFWKATTSAFSKPAGAPCMPVQPNASVQAYISHCLLFLCADGL